MAGQNTILIVDDDETIAHSMAAALNNKGYTTILAHGAEAGLKAALSERPALIVLDYNMPDQNGVEVLERLRQDDWGKHVPVIVASNVYEVDIINALITLGVQDYVLKIDVNLEDIVALVGTYVPPTSDTQA